MLTGHSGPQEKKKRHKQLIWKKEKGKSWKIRMKKTISPEEEEKKKMYSYFQSENSSLMWVFYLNQKQGTISEIPECLKKKNLCIYKFFYFSLYYCYQWTVPGRKMHIKK